MKLVQLHLPPTAYSTPAISRVSELAQEHWDMIVPLIRQSSNLDGLTTPNDKYDINPGPECATRITGVTLPEVVSSIETEHVELPTGRLQSVVVPMPGRGIIP